MMYRRSRASSLSTMTAIEKIGVVWSTANDLIMYKPDPHVILRAITGFRGVSVLPLVKETHLSSSDPLAPSDSEGRPQDRRLCVVIPPCLLKPCLRERARRRRNPKVRLPTRDTRSAANHRIALRRSGAGATGMPPAYRINRHRPLATAPLFSAI